MKNNSDSTTCPQCGSQPGQDCRIYGTCWFGNSSNLQIAIPIPELKKTNKMEKTKEYIYNEVMRYINECNDYEYKLQTAERELTEATERVNRYKQDLKEASKNKDMFTTMLTEFESSEEK